MTRADVEARIPLRSQDFDRQGIVNNAKHLELLEAARWRWAEATSAFSTLREGEEVFTTGISIQYLKAIPHGSRAVIVSTAIATAGIFKLQLRQIIRAEGDATLHSTALVDLVAYDVVRRKPTPHGLRKVETEGA